MIKSMMRLILLFGIMVTTFAQIFAQSDPNAFGFYIDALRFSRTAPTGTARIQGIGGAHVALGGDVSTALVNPAGLGFYNSSEFTITPIVNLINTDATYNGMSTIGTGLTRFSIDNLGLVISKNKKDFEPGSFRGGSFALNVSRINDFNQDFNYDGFNETNSIIDFFLNQSQGIPFSEISTEDFKDILSLAFNTFLTNPALDDQGNAIPATYDSFVLGFPRQTEEVKTRGSQYQWSLAAGANWNDKLYLGLNVGIHTMRYEIEQRYVESEFLINGQPDVINDLTLNQNRTMDGVGVSGTFGLIYRPVDIIRFGLSFTTPTRYSINEENASDLLVNYDNFFYEPADTLLTTLFDESTIFINEFTLRTPWKLTGGISFFAGKNGFISADAELVDYASARISNASFEEEGDNNTISNLYKSVVNFRVGGEYRLKKLRLRAGYAVMPDPININDGVDTGIQRFSGGLGYRSKKFFSDLAVVHSRTNDIYTPYFLPDGTEPIVELSQNNTKAVITVGFRF